LLGGIATTVTLFSLNHPAVHEAFGIEPLFLLAEPYLYFSVWAFAVSISLLVLVSLTTRPDPEEKTRYVIDLRGGHASFAPGEAAT
ncbi:MAG: hypothetical protein AB7K24_22520, partial [Gemmataceae bacterium]